jgi:hypothetical protein
MSSSLLLPNPCLLGILFTIATHDGSHLIFHYPPKPNEFGFQATPLDINEVSSEVEGLMYSSDSDLYNDEDEDEDDDDEDDDDESDENDDYEEDFELSLDDNESTEFDNSDIDSSGTKSQRSLSTESLIGIGNVRRHRRASSSSNNKYQSGRDLLEMMYELEQKKKHKKLLRRKRRLRAKKKKDKKNLNDIQSLKSSLKTSMNLSESAINNTKDTTKKEYKIDKIFSFDTDFISDLATPPKPLCNTRFELTVEDMVFLGLPIHINDDGNWRVSRKFKKSRSKSVSTAQRSRKQSTVDISFSDDRKKETKNTHGDGKNDSDIDNEEDLSKLSENHLDNHDDTVVKAYEGNMNLNSDDDNKEKESIMYQFNMLFVMNPPVVEYNHRIDEMFHYIISRISLLLRYEQQKTNYVWNEAQKILKLREELIHIPIKEQWKTIIKESSLARVITDTYNAVIKSDIVNIEINGKLNSFQIPIRKEFITLPPSYIELPEGSTLSSISPFNQLNNFESQTSLSQTNDIMGYFGLILLDDTERIIRDIKVEKDSVIASFIRLIRPNESLQRLSILSGLDIQEVKMFANHLVYWRRAMAILPLTSRSIYVCSPIAPIKNIYKDATKFNQAFPSLPPLPTFLSMISNISTNKPKPISNIIPSRDHRDLYMDAIGWLFKNGYITQLYTFLYLKISKDIKIQVAEEIEIEIKKKLELKKKNNILIGESRNDNEEKLDDEKLNVKKENIDKVDDMVNKLNDIDVNIDHTDISDEHVIIDLDNDTVSNDPVKIDKNEDRIRMTDNTADPDENSNTNTITDKLTFEKSQIKNIRKYSHRHSSISASRNILEETDNNDHSDVELHPLPSETDSFNNGGHIQVQFEEEEEEDTILLDPEYCTSLERRWIAKVVDGQPTEVVNLFYRVLKYMNGRSAQEVFLLRENISRQDMRRLSEALAESLVVVRHW